MPGFACWNSGISSFTSFCLASKKYCQYSTWTFLPAAAGAAWAAGALVAAAAGAAGAVVAAGCAAGAACDAAVGLASAGLVSVGLLSDGAAGFWAGPAFGLQAASSPLAVRPSVAVRPSCNNRRRLN